MNVSQEGKKKSEENDAILRICLDIPKIILLERHERPLKRGKKRKKKKGGVMCKSVKNKGNNNDVHYRYNLLSPMFA